MPFGRRKSKAAPVHRNDTVAKAVITPAVSTMLADGSVSEIELSQLANLCSFSPIFFNHSQVEVENMIKHIIQEIATSGHPATIQRASTLLTPELGETALCFAMRIALADGVVDEGERNALALTGQVLGVPPQTFGKILEIVAMMQRPAMAA